MRFLRRISARFIHLVAALAIAVLLTACSKPAYDTTTPEALLDAIQRAVKDGRPEDLPQFIEIAARDVEFEDGVTEASAIGDVKGKLSDMLGRLGRVSSKLKRTFEAELAKEAKKPKTELEKISDRFGFGPIVENAILDPFKFLDSSRSKLKAEDLGDGTAALSYDGKPIAGGFVALVETSGGWRVTVPVELVQSNKYWPQTRHEWAVLASIILAVENSLKMFEKELDQGKFKTIDKASERVGRLLGESVIVQSVIYATMKDKDPGNGAVKSSTKAKSATNPKQG